MKFSIIKILYSFIAQPILKYDALTVEQHTIDSILQFERVQIDLRDFTF